MSSFRSSSRLSDTSRVSDTDPRRKKNKMDEAIRRRAVETARKREERHSHNSSGQESLQSTPVQPGSRQSHRKRRQGTVASLRPVPAMTVPHSLTVHQASQLCAAKRHNSVLVVDDDENLCGIFTAKDIAYKVVAEGLDPSRTLVSEIMTPNPMVARDTTSATEALETMVERGFRHLPVCNEDGDVIGLLDIQKVFHENLEKMEKSQTTNMQLYSALDAAWGSLNGGAGAGEMPTTSPQNDLFKTYVEMLKDKMSFSRLEDIIDPINHPAATSTPRKSVREVAQIMRGARTTAVCIMDDQGHVAGIFTTKDIVLRVIAAGHDAATCSVVRVMTPHPDVATPDMNIKDALRQMNDGRYLNLPVVEAETGALLAIVGVLQVTYATLEQLNALTQGKHGSPDISFDNEASRSGSYEEHAHGLGKLLSTFPFGDDMGFDDADSIAASDRTRNDLLPSDSASFTVNTTMDHSLDYSVATSPSLLPSPFQKQQASTASRPPSRRQGSSADLSKFSRPRSAGAIRPDTSSQGRPSWAHAPSYNNLPPIEEGQYLFKFVAPSGFSHRFQAPYSSLKPVRALIAQKLAGDPILQLTEKILTSASSMKTPKGASLSDQTSRLSLASPPDPNDFLILYQDDDDDLITITSDQDLLDAVAVCNAQARDRLLLTIRPGQTWTSALERLQGQEHRANAASPNLSVSAASSNEDSMPDTSDTEPEEVQQPVAKPRRRRRHRPEPEPDLVFGNVHVSKDVLLPASVSFLAMAIVGVFVAGRPH